MTQTIELHNDDFLRMEISKLEKEIERSDKKIEKLNIIKKEADKEIEALKAKKEEIKSSIQQMCEKSTDEIEQQKLAYLEDKNQASIDRRRTKRKKELLREFVRIGDIFEIYQVVQRLDSLEDIDIVSEFESPYIRKSVARHPLVTLDILYKLANDEDRSVYEAAIENPIMPLEKLIELSTEEKKLLYILYNPVTTRELLLKILDYTNKLKDERRKDGLTSTAYQSRSCPIWLSVSSWNYETKPNSLDNMEYRLKKRYLDNVRYGCDYDMFKPILGQELYNKYYLDNRSALKQDLKELSDYISTMEDEEEKYLMNKKMKKIVELVSAGLLS